MVLKPAQMAGREEIEFGDVLIFFSQDFLITVRHGEAHLHDARIWRQAVRRDGAAGRPTRAAGARTARTDPRQRAAVLPRRPRPPAADAGLYGMNLKDLPELR
jgi:Mg2+ and Co2+ transporter CorA